MLWFSQSFNPTTDLPSLKGKVIVVTGANSGIGLSTVKLLASKGAKVYLGARSEEKFDSAYEILQTQGLGEGEGEVVWLPFDLSTAHKARESAERFLEREERLDVLVNNAAMTDVTAKPTFVDGIPDMMMINYIGTFVFTLTLLPHLVKTSKEPNSDVRIVMVTSAAFKLTSAATSSELHFDSVESLKKTYEDHRFSGFVRYSIAKLGNILFTSHLQSLLKDQGHDITCIAVHPGAVNTFAHKVPFPFSFIVRTFFTEQEVGAYTSVIAAAGEEAREWKGKYLEPVGRVVETTTNAKREDLSVGLWDVTREYLGSVGICVEV